MDVKRLIASRVVVFLWYGGETASYFVMRHVFLQINAILNFKHLAYTSGEGGRIHLY